MNLFIRKNNLKLITVLLLFTYVVVHATLANALINIVAAENVYGETAKQLGGPYVQVLSILNNPTQDPHLFTITPSTAKAITQADIIIYNGADYDPWMNSLLAIKNNKATHVMVIAELMDIKSGANPHLWYMPETMPHFAQNFVNLLVLIDPEHQKYFKQQLEYFKSEYQIIFATIKRLKQHLQNTPIIATEPLFNYMALDIGLQIHGQGFQMSIMNGVPPSISQIKEFEDDLRQHTVKLFIYNIQVINPLTQHMLDIAKNENIPVIGITEMLPPNTTYIQWMMKQLTELEKNVQR